MTRALLLALALVIGTLGGVARADVPQTVPFAARLVDDTTGEAMTGAQRITFELFDAATNGTSLWNEARDLTPDTDGTLFVELGETKAFPTTLFDGKRLYLSVKVGDTVLEPRVALASVPYAIKSGASDSTLSIGGLTADQLQQRVNGTCGSASFVTAINPDGTVVCTLGATGTGDITSVTAGNGLQGGAASGDATVSLLTCGANQVLKSNGTTWACANDADSGGDITGVNLALGGGLVGGGSAGDVTIGLLTTCAPGQLLKWTGVAWGCANDIDTDTNSGGDITSVNTPVGSGLQGGVANGDATLSLITTCAAGQLLKWNGSAWICGNDTDTNSGGTITSVLPGNGLSGGGSSGSVTLAVSITTGLKFVGSALGLDTTYTDSTYINASGDTMTGTLVANGINMNGTRVTNRGCPTGYVSAGPGLCVEPSDFSGYTFATCANRCRTAGTHMCSSAEARAVLQSGITLTITQLLDWMDDQDAAGSALYVTSTASAETLDAVRATSTSSYCRCCASIE